MNVRTILVVSALFGISASAFAADWPRFRGPKGDGISPEVGINKNWAQKKPETLWTAKMSDGGFAGPSVADGKVFIIDHQGDNDVVRALELASGKQVWEATYAEPGKPDNGFSRSTPTFDNGKLYTISRFALVNCYDAATGKTIWTRNIKNDFNGQQPQWQWAMSPVIDGNAVILVPGGPNAAVVKLNKETGETIWAGGGSDKPGYATPVIATINGKKQYVIFTATNLIGVDSENGKLLWSFPWKTEYDVNAASPVPVGKDMVFITTNYGRGGALVRIAGNKAEAVWENKEIQSHFSTPVLIGSHLYGITDPGDIVCVDVKTGKSMWRQKGFQKGGVAAVDRTIIGLDGKDGDAVMFEARPDACKELGRFKPLGGQSWTAPIVADGKLIVRNTQALACFDLK